MYYVYLHKKPSGEVFYVGKGKDNRAWSISKRNPIWHSVVKKYPNYAVEIFQKDLQEWYAFELELDLINYYGLRSNGGTLVNLIDRPFGQKEDFFTGDFRKLLSDQTKGSKNPNCDRKVYDFVNIETGEKFNGTRVQFKQKYDIYIGDLFSNKINSSNGWTLIENLGLKFHKDLNQYTFKHITGSTFTGLRTEFKKKFGVCVKPLFNSNGRCKSVSGWSLLK